MRHPPISVIVVTRNDGEFLRQALNSLEAQQRQPDEIVLVDGRSTDATQTITRRFDRVRYVLQDGTGLAEARNQGLSEVRGDWIAFLDDDDLWDAQKLLRQAAHLASHPDAESVLCHLKLFHEPGERRRRDFRSEALEHAQPGWTPGAMLARRSVFESVGTFNPSLSIACDSDWFARSRDLGIAQEMLPEALLYKRIHSGSLSTKKGQYRREVLRMMARSMTRKRRPPPNAQR